MATLFLAKRTGAAGFARPVAIKVVHPELANDLQFRQMFLDEALLSSRIHHPNVVHVEELAEHQGLHYLVMEFVHGCSLAQLSRALVARKRRLSPAFATRIAMHVAEALHAAHETRDAAGRLLEVVHRDVSPENILLAYAGHVKLIDFGIAKAYGRRHKTQEGLLKGKFRYMSPEQAQAKTIDRRTDIYQLGIVLWEMLTQRKLFDADNDVALLAQVREPKITPPSKLVDRIPPALDAAVMTALAKNPARRHPDAQVFARALAKALPAAHDVDSGALSALLLATMDEHRSRQKATYPEGIYERLDQQIETLPMGGGGEAPALAERAAVQKYTIENTAPYGSDASPGEAAPVDARGSARERDNEEPRPSQGAAEITASEGAPRPGNSESSSPSVRPWPADGRKRRLVRLASELRTTFTAIENELRGKHGTWLTIGAAIALAFVLAFVTALMRLKPHRPPPALPNAALARAPAPLPPPVPIRAVVAGPDASASANPTLDGGGARRVIAPAAEAGARGESAQPAQQRRLPALGSVDGTPLFTEPGF
jgi:serine/threonine-protein kinase